MPMTINGNDVEGALDALELQGGGILPVPAGTWTGYFDLDASNITFQGEGMFASTMRFVSGTARPLIDGGGSAWRNNVRFADLCLDGNNEALMTGLVRAPGYGHPQWVFERVWFKDFTIAFGGDHVTHCKFINCLFTAPGNSKGTSILLTGGSSDIDVVGCTFNWVNSALIADSGGGEVPSERIRFLGNTVRQDWWATKMLAPTSPYVATNVGTATYSATVLTDPGQSFDAFVPNDRRLIRVMPVLWSGSTANLGNTILQAAPGTFSSVDVQYGDIVRTATAWTMVTQKIDPARLAIDGWRALDTYLPVASPPNPTPVTLYRVYTGEVETEDVLTNTIQATTLQVGRWRDLLGNDVSTIPSGTRYEILGNRAAAGIAFEEGVRDSIVSDNVFSGCVADQITLRGRRHLAANNMVTHGQDMGMNLRAHHTLVSGGQYSYNGVCGIINSDCDDVVIMGVTCVDNQTVSESVTGADIQIEGDRALVQGCTLRKENAPNDVLGVYVRAGASNVRVFDNDIVGRTVQIGANSDVTMLAVRALFEGVQAPTTSFYTVGPVSI